MQDQHQTDEHDIQCHFFTDISLSMNVLLTIYLGLGDVVGARETGVCGERQRTWGDVLVAESMLCADCWTLGVVGVKPATPNTVMFALAPCIWDSRRNPS